MRSVAAVFFALALCLVCVKGFGRVGVRAAGLGSTLLRRAAASSSSSSAPETAGRRLQRRVVDSLRTAAGVAAGALLLRPSAALAAPGDETVTNKAYFDIAVDGAPAGRVVFGLFGNAVPLTARNFLEISKGYKAADGKLLTYVGSPFHRVIPGFMNQGGDITRGDGRGGVSIYGGKFKDESFSISNKELYLSMANAGQDTNGSQFFIITRPTGTPWLDGKHVVFGKVIEGEAVVKKIESLGSQSGQTSARITVAASGELLP